MNREQKLEEALRNILKILDGSEIKSAQLMAFVHGWRCDMEVSKNNEKIILAAYELLGIKRSMN